MELELMKRSNLYKEMKEGVELEIEEEIVSNFFNFFRQICVDEEKDFDETVALIIDIVILLDVDKFLENFWTIRIIDFYCFDTNDTLARLLNLFEEQSSLEKLDFNYINLALFQRILYYPSSHELSDKMKTICIKHRKSTGNIMYMDIVKYWVIVDDKLSVMTFWVNDEQSIIVIDDKEYNSYINIVLYEIYTDYALKYGKEYAEKIFTDIVTIANFERNEKRPTNIAEYFKCPVCKYIVYKCPEENCWNPECKSVDLIQNGMCCHTCMLEAINGN